LDAIRYTLGQINCRIGTVEINRHPLTS
jgi:hypothetical protein